MNHARWILVGRILTIATIGFVAGCGKPASKTNSASSTGDKSTSTATAAADDLFAVPQGSVADLLDFIHKLASPEPFKNEAEMNAFKQKASRAINAAADRVIAKGDDEQVSEGVGWKLEALHIMGELGDNEAADRAQVFLDKMVQDKRPEVRGTAVRLRFNEKVRKWQSQDTPQRLAVFEEYAAAVKANGLSKDDAQILLNYSDMCSGLFPSSDEPVRVYRELLPLFRDSKDEKIAELTGKMEATIRRLELPGQKLALEGTLFDGKPLDWDSYRGKLVLIDFWATDCPECIYELPSLVRLYRAYHDKGFEILGVNLDHDRPLVAELLAKAGITWPQLFDDNPNAGHWEHPVANKYAIDALPRMILVDKDGTVVHTNARGSLLAEELKKRLGEPVMADTAIPTTVPDGTAVEIMAFVDSALEKLPPPRSPEERQQSLEKVRSLLSAASDKILAGDPTMQQASQAIQMKLASLRGLSPGGPGASKEQDEYLASLEKNAKPVVAGALAEFRLLQAIARWEDLPAADRAAVVDKYVPFVKHTTPSVDHLRIASNLAMSAETGDMALVKRLVDALLPLFKDGNDPQLARVATMLAGIGRRADLPGNQLQLEGTFLDGAKIDWASYRGKVVLVDFWASWCGPCRDEVPNILRNYKEYHDKGFEVVGVCLDDEPQPAKAYIQQAGIPWPSLFSSEPGATGFDAPIATHYGITAIPVAILVDREGKVVTMMARGPMLEEHLKKLLSN